MDVARRSSLSRLAACLIVTVAMLLLGTGVAAATGAPNPQAPGPPELQLVATSATGVTFDAIGPGDYWNAPITGYTITGEPGDISVQVPVHHGDFLISGLAVGTTYTFSAVANTDTYGPGYPSDPVMVTPAPNPNLPGRPVTHLTSVGDGSIHAAWQPPADDGGSPVISYTVQWRDVAELPFPAYQTATVPATQLSYDITGLPDQTPYDVDVRATTAVGDSLWFGDAVDNILTPQPPTDLQLTAAGPNQLHVSWSAPSTGSQIVGYLVTATDLTDSTHPISVTTTDTQTTLDVNNDVSYQVQVSAVDGSAASSPPATGQSPMTHLNVPDAPALALVSTGSGQVQLRITAPSNDGGTPVSSYTIVDGSHAIAQTASAGVNGVSGLHNGTTYSFSATASNSQGPSASSAAVTVTPVGPPTPPQLSVTTQWYALTVVADAPTSNGGSPITRYTVTVSRPGSPIHTLSRTTPGAVTFTGLAPLTGYTVHAVAQNAVGTSGTAIKEVRTTALPAVISIPATRLTPVPGMSISLSGAGLFGIGSGAVTPAARAQLTLLARDLTSTTAIRCEGFADNASNTLANYLLGLSRASTVCNTLRADGVRATTSVMSYGGTHPMWSRRVVVFVQR